jgi:hypothetical protein
MNRREPVQQFSTVVLPNGQPAFQRKHRAERSAALPGARDSFALGTLMTTPMLPIITSAFR